MYVKHSKHQYSLKNNACHTSFNCNVIIVKLITLLLGFAVKLYVDSY